MDEQRTEGLLPVRAEGWTVYPVSAPLTGSVGDVNLYVLDQGGDGLTLIDAGVETEECFSALQETLRAHGFALGEIRRIFLTHSHPDHTGLVNRIAAEVPEVRVYAHRNALVRLKRDPAFLEMRVRFFERLYREMGCGEAGERQVERLRQALVKNASQRLQPDVIPLSGGDLPDEPGLTVLEVPGHSPDHIAFWDERRRWLFGGDVLLKHMSSGAFVEPDERGERRRSLAEHAASLQRFLELGPASVFAGHGGVIDEPEPLLRLRLARIGEKAERVLRLLADGENGQTAWQLAAALYPGRLDSRFGPVMSEVIGLLDLLEARGQIGKAKRGEVWHYHPSPWTK